MRAPLFLLAGFLLLASSMLLEKWRIFYPLAAVFDRHAASSNQKLRQPCSARPNFPTIAVTR
jgi:hypothetical protein